MAADLARLKKDGLMVGYPDGLLYHDDPTTASVYELAVMVSATTSHLKNLLAGVEQELSAQGNKRELPTLLVTDLQAISGLEGDVITLHDLTLFFQKQLRELRPGYPEAIEAILSKSKSGIARLRSQIPQFKDVPGTHWAAEAVLELRRAGILDGYPGQTWN
jgi:hypothetical protein